MYGCLRRVKGRRIMKDRWLPVGILAGVLFAINAVTRFIAWQLVPKSDTKQIAFGFVGLGLVALVMAVAGYPRARARTAPRAPAPATRRGTAGGGPRAARRAAPRPGRTGSRGGGRRAPGARGAARRLGAGEAPRPVLPLGDERG